MTYLPITLDPWTPIPAEAPLSAGMTQADADALAAASEAHAPESTITMDAALVAPLYITITLSAGAEPAEGYSVFWQWGDGQSETGHDDLQGHGYAAPGSYVVQARIQQPGRNTIDLFTTVVVDDEPPV